MPSRYTFITLKERQGTNLSRFTQLVTYLMHLNYRQFLSVNCKRNTENKHMATQSQESSHHAWMMQPAGCLTQNDDYIVGGIGWFWNVGIGHLVYFVCSMVDSK
jgi:hypothetical protein